MRHIGLSVLLCLVLSASTHGETIALWNFNDAVSGTPGGTNEFLVDRGSGTMTSDFALSNISNTTGSSLNSQNSDPAGRALVLSGNSNNGGNLTWMADTEGFDTIQVSFAAQRTSTGFNDNEFLYSVDSGISWTNFGSFTPGASFGIQSFDLSGIPALSNNPDAGFRIIFAGASASAGNNKIDNLLVSGAPYVAPDTSPVPEPSTIGLTAAGILFCLIAGLRRRI